MNSSVRIEVHRGLLDRDHLAVLGDGDRSFEAALTAVVDDLVVRVEPGVVREHQVLHAAGASDDPGLLRVEVPVALGRRFVTDPRARLADERVRVPCGAEDAFAQPRVAGVGEDLSVREVYPEGYGVGLAEVVVDLVRLELGAGDLPGDRAVAGIEQVAPVDGREREASRSVLHGAREVDAVERVDAVEGVVRGVDLDPRPVARRLPAESGSGHPAARRGLQELREREVIGVFVTDGEVSDLVRFDPALVLQPFGNARRDVEEDVLVAAIAPPQEEAGMSPTLPAASGVAGSGTENVQLCH